jgi:hypothetical protein
MSATSNPSALTSAPDSTWCDAEILARRGMMDDVERYQSTMAIFDLESRFLLKEICRDIRSKNREMTAIVAGIIDKGQRQGYFRNVESPRIIALAILGMGGWAHRRFR